LSVCLGDGQAGSEERRETDKAPEVAVGETDDRVEKGECLGSRAAKNGMEAPNTMDRLVSA